MRLNALLVLPAVWLVAPSVRASATYPDAVATTLKLAEDPACTLCHTTELGKKGTATLPFARSLKLCGAGEKDVGLLKRALACSEQRRYNSDADGAADIDELRSGTDPNRFDVPLPTPDDAGSGGEGGQGVVLPPPLPPPPFADVPLPQTGCRVVAPASSSASSGWLVALALAGVWRRRHRNATLASFLRG